MSGVASGMSKAVKPSTQPTLRTVATLALWVYLDADKEHFPADPEGEVNRAEDQAKLVQGRVVQDLRQQPAHGRRQKKHERTQERKLAERGRGVAAPRWLNGDCLAWADSAAEGWIVKKMRLTRPTWLAPCSDGSALASSIQNGKRTSVISDTERGPRVERFQATGTKTRTSPAATGRKSGGHRSFRT